MNKNLKVLTKKKKNSKKRSSKRTTDYFIINKKTPNYKDIETLTQFINKQGRIMPGINTKLTAKNQRAVAKAIKRARQEGLLPYIIVQQNEIIKN